MRQLSALAFAAAFVLGCGAARAEIPDLYAPIVPPAAFSFTQRLFDLDPAFARARQLDKPLFIYLGASDCPPCVDYVKFLDTHHAAMKPVLDSVVVVDLRTWLRGPKVALQLGGKTYTVEEFKALVGDHNPGFSYPWFWLLTPQGRQLRQLPYGLEPFMTVAGHARLLARP